MTFNIIYLRVSVNISANLTTSEQYHLTKQNMMKYAFAIVIVFTSLFKYARAQKGDLNISVGPMISFPTANHRIPGYKIGGGIEATGEYYLASRSAILLQAGRTSLGRKQVFNYYNKNLKLISLKGGYKYDIGSSGLFLNGLIGTDIEVEDKFTSASFTLGAGKRFFVKDIYFIDAGIDYIDGDTERRINIKAAFSILRRPKKTY